MLAGTVVGGWQMARAALAAEGGDGGYDAGFREAKVQTARFYFGQVLPRAHAYGQAATAGADSVMKLAEERF